MPPKSLDGRYVFGDKLGSGSFGVVRQGLDKETGEQVAIKLIEKQAIGSVEDVNAVLKEFEVLNYFNHPNIAKLYEVVDSETHFYVVMELCAGGTLQQRLDKGGPLPESEARTLFRQIVAGVEHCHKKRVVHRDLKLENILLTSDGVCKIADFGLSTTVDDDSLLRSQCGTLEYVAPEIVLGKRYKGPPVDVWSLGVILYTMVCGYLPFHNPKHEILRKNITDGKFHEMPDTLSQSCRDVLGMLLTTDPDRRVSLSALQNNNWFWGMDDLLSPSLASPNHSDSLADSPTEKMAGNSKPVFPPSPKKPSSAKTPPRKRSITSPAPAVISQILSANAAPTTPKTSIKPPVTPSSKTADVKSTKAPNVSRPTEASANRATLKTPVPTTTTSQNAKTALLRRSRSFHTSGLAISTGLPSPLPPQPTSASKDAGGKDPFLPQPSARRRARSIEAPVSPESAKNEATRLPMSTPATFNVRDANGLYAPIQPKSAAGNMHTEESLWPEARAGRRSPRESPPTTTGTPSVVHSSPPPFFSPMAVSNAHTVTPFDAVDEMLAAPPPLSSSRRASLEAKPPTGAAKTERARPRLSETTPTTAAAAAAAAAAATTSSTTASPPTAKGFATAKPAPQNPSPARSRRSSLAVPSGPQAQTSTRTQRDSSPSVPPARGQRDRSPGAPTRTQRDSSPSVRARGASINTGKPKFR